MKKVILLLSVFALVSCGGKTKDVILSEDLNTVKTNLDGYFNALTDLYKFNGVLLAYKSDTLLIEKAYNIHPNVDSSSYITTTHQFDIHSVSKLMTHYLIVKLSEDGKLSESQPIIDYYPDFPNGEKITIEMLLSHSSGLPRELQNQSGNEIKLSSDDIVNLAKKETLLFEPGTDVQYSNVGYEILYNIISNIYKKPFAQCVVDEIFIPLKMKNSGSHFFTDENRVNKLAKNHVLKDSNLVQVPNILEDEFKTARLYSTVSDLNTFLMQLENEPYRSAMKNKNGVIAKDGGSKGIRAQVYDDLENNFSFVLLANYDEIPFFDAINDVVKILKEEAFEMPKEVNRQATQLDRAILERYVGSYSFADFDGLILRVDIEGNNLIVYQNGDKIATLQPESETVFFENPKATESFEFIENGTGSYNALMGWKGISVEGKRIE